MNAAGNRQQEISIANAALREWAAGLRTWSRAARQSSADSRRRARLLRPEHATAPCPAHLPPLDPVPLQELRELLVEAHGFTPGDADRALATGMLVAGYPAGYDRLGAADAFALVEDILRGPWAGPQG